LPIRFRLKAIAYDHHRSPAIMQTGRAAPVT